MTSVVDVREIHTPLPFAGGVILVLHYHSLLSLLPLVPCAKTIPQHSVPLTDRHEVSSASNLQVESRYKQVYRPTRGCSLKSGHSSTPRYHDRNKRGNDARSIRRASATRNTLYLLLLATYGTLDVSSRGVSPHLRAWNKLIAWLPAK